MKTTPSKFPHISQLVDEFRLLLGLVDLAPHGEGHLVRGHVLRPGHVLVGLDAVEAPGTAGRAVAVGGAARGHVVVRQDPRRLGRRLGLDVVAHYDHVPVPVGLRAVEVVARRVPVPAGLHLLDRPLRRILEHVPRTAQRRVQRSGVRLGGGHHPRRRGVARGRVRLRLERLLRVFGPVDGGHVLRALLLERLFVLAKSSAAVRYSH